MRKSILHWKSILLLSLLFTNLISAQDTLLLHYANATISEIIPDNSANGAITGKGDDASKGKYMFFDSGNHRSPVTDLVAVLMDIEVSNFSELDSFIVFIQQSNGQNWEDRWEKKFSFSEIAQESTLISENGVAAYNFQVDLSDEQIADIGYLYLNIGIKYNYDSNAKIALRATGDGEFSDAETRCFTINENGSISDFVTKYGAEVGLAIFPVTFFSSGIQEISDMDIEIINNRDNVLIIRSANLLEDYNLSIFSLDGRLIKEKQLNSGQIVEINTSVLPSGIYIINATNENRRFSCQIFLP